MSPDNKVRLTGLGLCLIGLFLGWISVVEPILKAGRQVERINLFGVGPFLVGALITFGLVLVMLGGRADARMRDAQAKRMTTFGNVVFALCFLAGLATMLGPRLLLQSMGYQP
jgi:hypothetical protein